MSRVTVDNIGPSLLSREAGINGNGRGTIAPRGHGSMVRREWPAVPEVLYLQPSSVGYVSRWGEAHQGGQATSTSGVRLEWLLPWPCSSHGKRVRVRGEDTGVPELQEFGKAMPWHVRVRGGAFVRATVPRRCLELLRWKLTARRAMA